MRSAMAIDLAPCCRRNARISCVTANIRGDVLRIPKTSVPKRSAPLPLPAQSPPPPYSPAGRQGRRTQWLPPDNPEIRDSLFSLRASPAGVRPAFDLRRHSHPHSEGIRKTSFPGWPPRWAGHLSNSLLDNLIDACETRIKTLAIVARQKLPIWLPKLILRFSGAGSTGPNSACRRGDLPRPALLFCESLVPRQ